MKGLLIKDFKLMKNTKNSIVIILLVALAMSFYIRDLSFLVIYMAIIGNTFTSSTISYDEFDKGNAFLFSLPVSRRDYVMEKYLLSLLLGGGGWLLGTVFTICSGAIRNELNLRESVLIALILLPIALGINALMLPLRLKYEGEKSRISLMIVMGGFLLVVVAGAKVIDMLGIDLEALGKRLPAVSEGIVIAAAMVILAALLLLSCRISIRIMERKEF